MELFLLIKKIEEIINNFGSIDSLINLGRLYYKLVNYNKFIRLYIPNNLFHIYLNSMDAILYESYLGDEESNNITEYLKDLKKILDEIIELLNKCLLLLFSEDDFINNFIIEYYKEPYNPILCIYLEDFIGIYTDNNSLDMNLSIINNYTKSINEPIQLFNTYYGIEFNFTGTKINYDELAAISLYHYTYDKIQKIINDNYDSSKDTDEEN